MKKLRAARHSPSLLPLQNSQRLASQKVKHAEMIDTVKLETNGLAGIDLKPDELEPLLKLDRLKCLNVARKQLSRDQVFQLKKRGVKVTSW
jgi:hypothetical protein